VRASSWSLPVLSVLSLLVIAGSVGWAEITDAQPHASDVETADSAAAGDPADPGHATGTTFKICAKGNYAAYATLPDDGNAKSATAKPGTCVTQELASGDEHSVALYGLEGTTPFKVGDDEITAGATLTATGTIDNPDYTSE